MMDTIQYEKEYIIPVYEIGPDGKLNPHSLFNYLQDIASEHAVKLRFGKDDLMKENRFWVLSRIAAGITIWPGWKETIIIKTWPRGTDRFFAIRDFKVFYPDGRHIASASSSWLVVDRTTRRIQRPDTLLTRFNSDFPVESSLGRNAGKLDSIDEGGIHSNPFKVRISDLDVNLHTNNVAYLKWITDTYSLEFRMSHVPDSIEINYLAESKCDDEIVVLTSADFYNQAVYNHAVKRIADNAQLCRVQISWKNCSQ